MRGPRQQSVGCTHVQWEKWRSMTQKTRPNTADTEIPRASTRPALKLPTCRPAPHSTSVESSKYRPQTWIRTGTKVRLTHTRVTIRPPDRESAPMDFSRAPASSPWLPGGRFRCRVTRAARSDPPPRPSLTDTVPLPRVDLTYPPTFLRIRSRTHQEEAQRRHERRAQVRGRGAHPSIAFSFPADGVQRRASFPPQSR